MHDEGYDDTLHAGFAGNYNMIYSEADLLFFNIYHMDIYEWAKQNKDHVDLSESLGLGLKDGVHKRCWGSSMMRSNPWS